MSSIVNPIRVRFIMATLLALGVSACSTPPAALEKSGDSQTFVLPQPTAATYRKIVQGTRLCYPNKSVTSDYFPDNQTGNVTMSAQTSLNIVTLYSVQVSPHPDGSKVVVHFLKGVPAFAQAVKRWAAEDYSICPFG